MYCTYCGDVADCFDHVVPFSRSNFNRRKRIFKISKKEMRSLCVPSCTECNSLLGNKEFLTVGRRASYLHKKYKKRYSKLLSLPDWDAEEIEELEYTMRDIILKDITAKREIKKRIYLCKERELEDPTIEMVWFQVDLI